MTALKLDNHDLKEANERLERQVKETEKEVGTLRAEKSALQKEVCTGDNGSGMGTHGLTHTHTCIQTNALTHTPHTLTAHCKRTTRTQTGTLCTVS